MSLLLFFLFTPSPSTKPSTKVIELKAVEPNHTSLYSWPLSPLKPYLTTFVPYPYISFPLTTTALLQLSWSSFPASPKLELFNFSDSSQICWRNWYLFKLHINIKQMSLQVPNFSTLPRLLKIRQLSTVKLNKPVSTMSALPPSHKTHLAVTLIRKPHYFLSLACTPSLQHHPIDSTPIYFLLSITSLIQVTIHPSQLQASLFFFLSFLQSIFQKNGQNTHLFF